MSRDLVRGATLGLLTVGGERAVGFLILLVVARTLAPAEFGVFAYLLAGIAPIQVMADQGLEIVAVTAMARPGANQGAVLAALLAARATLWLVLAAPAALLVLGDPGGGDLRWAAFAASGLVLVGPSLPYRSLARARGEMGRLLAITLADALTAAAGMGAVLLAGGGAAALLTARVCASVAVTAIAAAQSPVSVRIPAHTAAGGARTLAATAWPLAVNALLLSLVVRLGHLTLMAVAGASAVAYLGAASRVAEMVSLLAEGVMLAVFPVMAARPESVSVVSAQVGRRLALLVLAAVVTVSSASRSLVLLLFGDAYLPAAGALAILAWGGLFAATGTLVLHGLVARGAQRLLLVTNVAAVAVTVALQGLLVPRLLLEGAAIATLVGLASGQALLAVASRSRDAVWASWRAAFPVVVLAAATQATVTLAGVGDPWRGVAAALLYVTGAAISGLLTREDVAACAAALRRTGSG